MPENSEKAAVQPKAPGDNMDVLQDVDITFSFILGYAQKTLDELTEMGEQTLVELDRLSGDPVDVLANGKLFAKGEVVTINENFAVRLLEIVRPLAAAEKEGGDGQ
jgi:flagellar motor switch protein FliN/FliY